MTTVEMIAAIHTMIHTAKAAKVSMKMTVVGTTLFVVNIDASIVKRRRSYERGLVHLQLCAGIDLLKHNQQAFIAKSQTIVETKSIFVDVKSIWYYSPIVSIQYIYCVIE